MNLSRKDELVELIKHHNELYYNQAEPEISDFEYDKLVKELKTIDPSHEVFNDLGRAVFGSKVKHNLPMGTLIKAHTPEEINQLNADTVSMPKIDGLSMSVVYIRGKLFQAITRGDGLEGEDVTANAMWITNLPKVLQVSNPVDRIEIRGEVYVNNLWFFNNCQGPKSISTFGREFANPRNYAVGSLKQENPKETAKRNLSFIAYRVLVSGSKVSKEGELEFLRKNLFEIPVYRTERMGQGYQVEQTIAWFNNERAKLHFDIDGIVFWINDFSEFEKRGFSGGTPNGALAYKFDTEKKSTKVKNFEWRTSRTGRIVPVMILEPVQLAGTTVQRCTMNNLDYLMRNNVCIGDEVEIEKANEIIPKLVRVVSKHRDNSHTPACKNIPTHCPSCNSPVAGMGKDVVCDNPNCGAQIVNKLLHFIKVMNVDGFSKGAIQKLVDSGLLDQKILFELDVADLQLHAGFGPRQASQFVKQIRNLKISQAEFLKSLGITGVGERVWTNALEVVDFDKFVDCNFDKFDEDNLINHLGKVTATKLIKGIRANEEFIKETLPYLKIVENQPVPLSTLATTVARIPQPSNSKISNLSGKIFCITGTLSQVRSFYVQEIENRGGLVSGISRKTDYLVCGIDAGSKLKKAKQLGITIISESELLAMF